MNALEDYVTPMPEKETPDPDKMALGALIRAWTYFFPGTLGVGVVVMLFISHAYNEDVTILFSFCLVGMAVFCFCSGFTSLVELSFWIKQSLIKELRENQS